MLMTPDPVTMVVKLILIVKRKAYGAEFTCNSDVTAQCNVQA